MAVKRLVFSDELTSVGSGTYLPLSGGTLTGTSSYGALKIKPTASYVSVIQHDSGIGALDLRADQINLKSRDGSETGISYNSGGTLTVGNNTTISHASNPVLSVIDTTNNARWSAYVTDTKVWMGAVSNHGLSFLQNDTERMLIDTSGNLTMKGNGGHEIRYTHSGNVTTIDYYNSGGYYDALVERAGSYQYKNHAGTVAFQINSDLSATFGGNINIPSSGAYKIGTNTFLTYNGNTYIGDINGVGGDVYIREDGNTVLTLSGGNATFSGQAHIKLSTAGSSVVANTENDDLVIETNGNTGMTMLSPDANDVGLGWGSASLNRAVLGKWNYNANSFRFRTNKANAIMVFGGGESLNTLTLDGSDNATFGGSLAVGGSNISGIKIRGQQDSDTDVNISTATFNNVLSIYNATNNGANNNTTMHFGGEPNAEAYISLITKSNYGDLVFSVRGSSGRAEALRLSDTSATFGGDVNLSSLTDAKPVLTLEQTANNLNGANIVFLTSGTANDNDISGTVRFKGLNDASETIEYGTIYVKHTDVSNGTEDSQMHFRTMNAGTFDSTMIISSGNVGIGTTSPDTNMHIHKASAGTVDSYSESVLTLENSGNTALNILSGTGNHGQIAFGDSGQNDDGILGYDQGSSKMYILTNHESTKKFVVDASGNVGIGTDSPEASLDVNTTIAGNSGTNYGLIVRGSEVSGTNLDTGDGIGLKFEIPIDTATSNIGASIEAVKSSYLDSNSETKMILKTSGNDETLDTAFTIFSNQNTAIEATKGFYLDGGSNTFISEVSADTMQFTTGGSERLKIDSSGNVGIGVANVGYRLDVEVGSGNEIARFQGANSGSLVFRNSTSNEFIMYTGTSDALVFATGGNNEKVRITSDGKLGIGTNSFYSNDYSHLSIKGDSTSGVSGIAFQVSSTVTSARNWSITSNNSAHGSLDFRYSSAYDSTPNTNLALSINSSGNATFSGNVTFNGTASFGGALTVDETFTARDTITVKGESLGDDAELILLGGSLQSADYWKIRHNQDDHRLIFEDFSNTSSYVEKFSVGQDGNAKFSGDVNITGNRYMLYDGTTAKGALGKDSWWTAGGSSDDTTLGCYSGDIKMMAGAGTSAVPNVVFNADKTSTFNGGVAISGAVNISRNDSDEFDTNSLANPTLLIKNTNTSATQPHSLIGFRLDKNGGDGYLGFIAGGSVNQEHFVLGNQVDGELLRIASGGNTTFTGNVFVGTNDTTADGKLHISGINGAGIALNNASSGNNNMIRFQNGGQDKWDLGQNGNGDLSIYAYESGTTILTIDGGTDTTTFNGDVDIKSTDATASSNPQLNLRRVSSSVDNNDALGKINFYGEDSIGDATLYADIMGEIDTCTHTIEKGNLHFRVMENGSMHNIMKLKGNGSYSNIEMSAESLRLESTHGTDAIFKIEANVNYDPTIRLQENGTTHWSIYNDTSDSDKLNIHSNGYLVASFQQDKKVYFQDRVYVSGNIQVTSDIAVKKDITTISNGLDKVSQLRGVNYTDIRDNEQKLGVIAQEVESVLPSVVTTEEHKSVDYNQIIPMLIESIKELKTEVESLKAKIGD